VSREASQLITANEGLVALPSHMRLLVLHDRPSDMAVVHPRLHRVALCLRQTKDIDTHNGRNSRRASRVCDQKLLMISKMHHIKEFFSTGFALSVVDWVI
jgi:hypothetical protein